MRFRYPRLAMPMLAVLLVFSADAQTPAVASDVQASAPATPSDPIKPGAEISSSDAPATFTSRATLVPVTVVVRDNKGNAVGTLTKDDFRIVDNGKPQVITKFSIERPAAPVVIEKQLEMPAEAGPTPTGPALPRAIVADHFAAYVFDDLNLGWEDLTIARDAALKLIAQNLRPSERVAIYTTSGQTVLDFTDERPKIEDALHRLMPRPIANGVRACPDLSYYMANQIINQHDPEAIQAATAETYACGGIVITTAPGSATAGQQTAQQMMQSSAQRALAEGEYQTRLTMTTLRQIVTRVSAMPGQRHVVLISPGFLTLAIHDDLMALIDRAVRSRVIVSTLDARGVFAPQMFTAGQQGPVGGPLATMVKSRQIMAEASSQSDILGELAAGTGGNFFQNSNDLREGFRRLAAAPEYLYVLGFSPSLLKSDGRFHTLKVSVHGTGGISIQARHGYFAPKRETTLAQQAHQDIEDALFSREVQKDLPLDIRTQFFKSSDDDAKLTVLARVDAKRLHFRQEAGRNNDVVTVVAALFDPNGNYLRATSKLIDLKLKDETLSAKPTLGITIKLPFDVKVGSYVVRVVARDAEGQMLAADNGVVEIP